VKYKNIGNPASALTTFKELRGRSGDNSGLDSEAILSKYNK
jgi:hypothetical protein